ncbi:MAG: ClpX C4-type zinc finger protein [Isosphaeraceae bacterium]
MSNPGDQEAGSAGQRAGSRCSFCNESSEDVGPLVESPTSDRPFPVFICGDCLELCSS